MNFSDYLANISLLLIGGFVTYGFTLLKPKSKLVFWRPHQFLFDKVNGTVDIHTQTYTIQNLGRESCDKIEIVHKNRPDYFKLQPERNYSEITTPTNEHIIEIFSLAPKEFFSVEILSHTRLPNLLTVRSKDGPAQAIQFLVQQVQPKWKTTTAGILILVGIIASGYALLKAVQYLYGLA